MPVYETRCGLCGEVSERRRTLEQQAAGNTVERDPCYCGGDVKIIITQVNLSVDATPTRGYGRSKNAPALVREDGKAVNPGHEMPNASMLRLTKDQVRRLELK